MKVIALNGWKQSGKDTLANYLVENHGFVRYAFADTLKNMVANMYNIPREHCDNPEFKETRILHYPVISSDDFSEKIHRMMVDNFRGPRGEKPTCIAAHNGLNHSMGVNSDSPSMFPLYWTPRALCILEGSIKRSVTNQFWTQTVIDTINKQEGLFVISDMRYRNEMNQLRNAFGDKLLTIRVNRFADVDTKDPSERDLDNESFDLVIQNYGSLCQYHETIKEQVCPLLNKF